MVSILRSYYTGANYTDNKRTEFSFERSSDITFSLATSRNWPVSIGNA